MRPRRAAVLLAVTLALAACTGGTDGGSSGDGGGDRPSSEGATSSSTLGSPIDAPGLDATVRLLGPAEAGAGPIPTFEWASVEGADGYRLVVRGADGNATWAWEGGGTSIVLGAVPEREAGDGGPILTAGSSWSVVALDGDGHAIAVSELRPASP